MNNNTILRQESIKRVFSAIRERGPLSKRQLQEITGFSWGNVSSITSLLTEKGYLMSIGKQDTGIGRRPESFDVNDNDNFIIGIDFNFQGVTAVLCSLNGKTVWETRKPFENITKDEAIEILCATVQQALDFQPHKSVFAIAIAMQGTVDTKEGISVRIDGIKDWENVPIAEMLGEKYDLDVFVFHDPDCLLYTEKYFGSIGGNDAENAILIRMDHDIGIGVMYRGTILMSSKGATCEIGTMIIPDQPNGECVLKEIASSISLAKKYAAVSGRSCPFDEIVALAEAGEPAAKALFGELGAALGVAVNNVSILLHPERVILYGTIAGHSDLFFEKMDETLKTVMGDYPAVLISKLGSNAAAIGATLFAADTFVENNLF